MKSQNQVSGFATAASIWVMGAIGMAVAYQQFAIGIVLSLANFLTLKFWTTIKKEIKGEGG